MATIGNLIVNIAARIDGLQKGIGKGIDLVQGATSKFKSFGANAGKWLTTGLVTGTLALGSMGAAATGVGLKLLSLGSDAAEMQSKFDTVFGDLGGPVQQNLDTFAATVERNKFELRGYAAELQDTLVPMGLAGDQAAGMSTDLVKLATDLSSFNNMPMDEAMRRLQGTLVGSHENALAFGVVINENTLAAEMAKNGWDKLSGAQLEAAKVQARYNLLMEGTTAAQGDAARTSSGWANQMRGLQSSLTEAATEIGMELLPVFTPLLSGLASLVREHLPAAKEKFSEFAGKLQDTVGPALAIMQDAWDRIVVAFGGSPGQITPASLALDGLGAILDAIVIAIQALAVGMDLLATAVERAVTWGNNMKAAYAEGGLLGILNQLTGLNIKLGADVDPMLKPGSPTPLETGLRGIVAAAREVQDVGEVGVTGEGGATGGGGVVNVTVPITLDGREIATYILRIVGGQVQQMSRIGGVAGV